MGEPTFDPAFLRTLALSRMPFGKYRGRPLCELPEAYLVWFRQRGWPRGLLGRQLATMLEIRSNGLTDMVRRIRSWDDHPAANCSIQAMMSDDS